MPKVEVTCDPYGIPTKIGSLVQMLTFSSDSEPLELQEEDSGGSLTFSTLAYDGAYAECETNIVVGPISRAVVTENGTIKSREGAHRYVLLLVECDEPHAKEADANAAQWADAPTLQPLMELGA